MISFDVENLFINVPLEKITKIILRKSCQEWMLNTVLRKFSLGKFPPGKFPSIKLPPGKFPSIKLPPGKFPPKKIATHKIPTWNIPALSIDCLSPLNTASIKAERVYMYILLPGQKIVIYRGRLRVFSWNFGNINKIFI